MDQDDSNDVESYVRGKLSELETYRYGYGRLTSDAQDEWDKLVQEGADVVDESRDLPEFAARLDTFLKEKVYPELGEKT